MNLNNVGIIISSEYSRRVRKKSFLITTFLTPLLLGLCFVIPFLIMLADGGEVYKVNVVDESGIVTPYLSNSESIEYVFAEKGVDVAALTENLSAEGLYAVAVISAQDENGDVSVTTYSDEPLNIEVKGNLKRAAEDAVKDYKLGLYNIDDLESILKNVETKVRVNSMTLTESGDAKEDSVEIYMIIAYVSGFLIYMFVLLFGNSVMTSVIDEKTSRVVEVLVASVRSVELMIGKILGVALVALTQFTIWVVLMLAIVFGVSTYASQKVGGSENVASMTQMASSYSSSPVDMDALIEGAAESGDGAEVIKIFKMMGSVDWALVIGCFLLYFIFGYLLYASMFAAVGASVDNAADTGQLALPVTAPLIIGLFLMLQAFEHPSSPLSVWASMIPWTSPMVMLARVPFGTVPAWQLCLSLALLFVTFVATAYLSARIYKAGILAYGKKSTFKDLAKWMKQK